MSPQEQTANNLAEPFSRIFLDRAEADFAFDLFRETVKRLRVGGAYDPRLAVTLSERSGKLYLRLNFGGWLVIGFRGPGQVSERVDLALLADQVVWDERLAGYHFETKEGLPQVRTYELPIQVFQPLTSEFRRAYETTLDFIADKFQSWQRATHWKQHNPEIVEACFDPQRRERLFADGLASFELLYEPNYRAFEDELVVAEDGAVYDAEAADQAEALPDETDPTAPLQSSTHPPFPPSDLPTYPLSQLAADSGYDEATLSRWLRAIERKGQIILYGPPGTGKTFIAEKLAHHLVSGGDGFVELVQFHPAYAYEDFIQGLRPQARADGGLDYALVPGRFLEFCRLAATRQDTCVLIIDEINRADLSRVFGELMYLLEYRNRESPLASGGRHRIPSNVRLVGTLNTADRSIALVDHALRRRFAFIPLRPNFDLLRRYHRQHESSFQIEGLIKVLIRLNRRIDDPHYELGITYFLQPNLAGEIGDIWQMEIEPYLEEYFFDRPETVTEFRWTQVRRDILGDS